MNLTWLKRKFGKTIFWLIQEKQYTPFQLMSIRGKHKSLKGFFAAKRMTLSDKESELISEFFFHVSEQNISSDKALGTFLFYARYSKKPGVDTLNLLYQEGRLPPTIIWYGNRDWMDHEDCHKKLTELGL